jgi:DNA-binding FadR family transcriptional regulator
MDIPFRRPALNELVRDYVKQYILDHALSAGDPLPSETQLAQDLGVGRSSVREAIKALQSLGIIEVRHGEGLYVREFSLDPMIETVKYGMRFDVVSLFELAQIRFFLERAAIEDVVRHISAENLGRLDDLMETWKSRVQAGANHLDLDEEFHRILYGTLNNDTFMKLYELFWLAFKGLGDPFIKQGRPAQAEYENHKAILDAVKARDVDLARTHLAWHFNHLLEERIRQATGTPSQEL